MTHDPSVSIAWDDRDLKRVASAAEDVAATLRVAAVLAVSGRRLDLAGLDGDMGRLCASVLDLPDGLGRLMQPRLAGILDELDRLVETVALSNPAAGKT